MKIMTLIFRRFYIKFVLTQFFEPHFKPIQTTNLDLTESHVICGDTAHQAHLTALL